MEAKGPNFSQDAKRAAVELWKAKVPLKNIREQLQMNERTLRLVLAAAKASPEDPVPKRKKTSGRSAKVMATALIVIRRHLVWDPTPAEGSHACPGQHKHQDHPVDYNNSTLIMCGLQQQHSNNVRTTTTTF